MGINLGGVAAWAVPDQLPPGTYTARPGAVERMKSSNGNEQVQIDWRVAAGEFTGAERRDWVTFTESAMGRVVQLIEACGQETPQEDFASYGDLADWVAKMLDGAVVTEIIVRLKPDRKGATNEDGSPKEWPEIAGYRQPGPGSDVPGSASDVTGGAKVANGTSDGKPLPF